LAAIGAGETQVVPLSYPSILAALVLALAYLAGFWIDAHSTARMVWAHRRWVSAAAGVSVAYVFVDLLPELAAQNDVIVHAAGKQALLFAEQRVYILALFSFVVLYGLQYFVLGRREAPGDRRAQTTVDAWFLLHMAGFTLYSGLIGYLLVERAGRLLALALYTVAMALHFLIVDHALTDEHGARYQRIGRWMLAASVLAGWLVGELAPLSEVNVARLFAVLAGGVVITSLRGELPDQTRGQFWPFCLGAVSFALILLFV
jgi:hypothetical protein